MADLPVDRNVAGRSIEPAQAALRGRLFRFRSLSPEVLQVG
jgi:hypothetical protein